MIHIYSPEEVLKMCKPCFGGWELEYKSQKISGVYINDDQECVTKEMTIEILDKINTFFPLHWCDTDILCLPFRPMLKDKNGNWTGTDFNGQAWQKIIALGAQSKLNIKASASAMIVHELWHDFSYTFIDTNPFDGSDTPEYREFKRIMGIENYTDKDIIWEHRPCEILAELGRYYAQGKDFNGESFTVFNSKVKPLREAYDYLMRFMPEKPRGSKNFIENRISSVVNVPDKKEDLKMRDINLLHPALKPKAEKLIQLAKAKGINIIISQTWRTKAEQDDLYAQGRTKAGQIVTNVKYPYSLHCWGVAFDVAVIINGRANWDAKYYDIVGVLGESLGLEWGGRWKSFVDRPHFQLPNIKIADLIKIYSSPEGYKNKWNKPSKEENKVGFEGKAKVQFEGKEINGGILKGTTYAGVREIAELLGLDVGWDSKNKTVLLSKKKQ